MSLFRVLSARISATERGRDISGATAHGARRLIGGPLDLPVDVRLGHSVPERCMEYAAALETPDL
eukprot:3382964-Pyramimonas_sp.AAC.1